MGLPGVRMTYTQGQMGRDAGVNSVLAANAIWKANALAAILALPAGTEGLFERFRALVVPSVGEPNHPNAWGGIASKLKCAGFLEDTGRTESSQHTASHYRRQPVLRRTGKVSA